MQTRYGVLAFLLLSISFLSCSIDGSEDSALNNIKFRREKEYIVNNQLMFKNEIDSVNIIHTYVIPGKFNDWIILSPNQTSEYVVQYSYLVAQLKSRALRVDVICQDCFPSHPVLVVVRQQKEVSSWELPLEGYINEFFMSYYNAVSRTMCPIQYNTSGVPFDEKQRLFLDFSTSFQYNITLSVRVKVIDDFLIRLNEKKTFVVEPPKPQFYSFQFPDQVNMVLVKVTSEQDYCTIIGVQNLTCPVFDLESNFKFGNTYQTMTLQAGITVRRGDYPNGFYIIVLTLPTDSQCRRQEKELQKVRRKTVVVSVEEKITDSEYLAAIFSAIGFCAFFYIVTLLLGCVEYIRERNRGRRLPQPNIVDNSLTSSIGPEDPCGAASISVEGVTTSSERQIGAVSICSSIDETDYDLLKDAEYERDIFRMKRILFVCDLARKDSKILRRKSNLYIVGLFTVAIFYAVPVIQLVFTYQNVLDETGNQDICFYNFLCSHPLGPFTDFNHLYSNIAYILFGILFIGVAARRDRRHRVAARRDCAIDEKFGIPQHFGLYYSMGGALLMEGLLSACYHICPNSSNIQFDTAFMYVIALLCMLKIYQTRHPDINASASSSYFWLAIAVLLSVMSVLNSGIYFWVAFAIFHFSVCIYLSVQIYYMGRFRLNKLMFRTVANWFQHERRHLGYLFTPVYCDRMVLLILGNAVNWSLSIYAAVSGVKNFASFLVIIFLANLLLYIGFYIIMKLRHGEVILLQPLIYLILCTSAWAASAYFFLNPSTSWNKSAAESRELNTDCLLLRFYDNHDIWHFLSASAMFFGFMLLLTLDDDLVFTPRNKIAVF